MTRYTVLWDIDLEREFIDTWVQSDSQTRAFLTDVANQVDASLSVDPNAKGTEAMEAIRLLDVPLTEAKVSVSFQVIQEDRQVRVLRLTFRRSK